MTKPVYHLIDDTLKFYTSLMEDFKNAQHSITLEVFRMDTSYFSQRILGTLVNAAQRGVVINMLFDSWGTSQHTDFFQKLRSLGANIYFFEKLRFSLKLDSFIRNHCRDHRKIFVIDNTISYIGSSNITEYNLNWRECMLRVVDTTLASLLLDSINKMIAIRDHYIKGKRLMQPTLYRKNMAVLNDFPSTRKQLVKGKFLELIKASKSSIIIETPYFLPSSSLRFNLTEAVKRGVDVTVVIPKESDVPIIDILRRRYLGVLYEKGITFKFYTPENLHAKVSLFDNKTFVLGSANFDYRSFRSMHEIVLCGTQYTIAKKIHDHLNETIKQTESFDYESWKRRSSQARLLEKCIVPFRHFL